MIKPLPNPRWRFAEILAVVGILVYGVFYTNAVSNDRLTRDQPVWAAIPPLALVVFVICVRVGRYSTNGRIRDFLGWPGHYQVFDERHPSYRLVDWLRAAERFAAGAAEASPVNPSNINQDLSHLLSNFSMVSPPPPRQERTCIGFEQFGFFPDEAIWLVRGPEGMRPDEKVVVRVRRVRIDTVVEVAAATRDAANVVLKRLGGDALANSIFRGQFIEVRYSNTPHRDYDYQFESAEMTVTFKPKPSVTADDIILEQKIEAILRRNLFEFYAHRDRLFALGLPRKRALLFYGPPGTGKTHTCRFIHSLLKGVTTILASGESLVRLQDIGKLARQLQPTLVILEDVDLVFHTREINPYGAALGDLMDQLDGFTPDEEVIFVLTTNAIERVEAAIRDRPGRINQCLFFGMPNPELRRRYLTQYLKPYDVSAVDFDHIVKQTEGTSQAFLKEYVLRAVQVAAETAGYPERAVPLRTEHFDVAFDELTSHGDPAGHSIMGFRTGPPRGFGVSG